MAEIEIPRQCLRCYGVIYNNVSHYCGEKPSAFKKQVNGDHYKTMPIQPVEFIVKNNIPFLEANAIKYICRHKAKGGITDLEKAKHYIEMAIEEYYGKT